MTTRERALSDIMDFDHVIEVLPDGSIIDRPDIYAPSLFDDKLDGDGWELMNGYSGQDRYSGPIMHNSEFIGGRMEGDIRSEPGVYVALVSYYPPENGDEDGELVVEGWAVAYRRSPERDESADGQNAVDETAYLSRGENGRRLRHSIAELEAGRGVAHDLLDDDT